MEFRPTSGGRNDLRDFIQFKQAFSRQADYGKEQISLRLWLLRRDLSTGG
jgi:hypothetical protein